MKKLLIILILVGWSLGQGNVYDDIDSDTNKILSTVALLYLIPLVIIIAGIFISKQFIASKELEIFSDVIALAIGLVLYAISLFLIHLFSKNKTIEYHISRR